MISKEEILKMTIGKKIGTIAFVISELAIIFACGMILYDWKNDKSFDPGLLGNIVFYQLCILGITWGSKASANFSNILNSKNEVKK